MIALLVTLLIYLLILGALWWCVNRLIGAFGLPAPIATVVQVVFVVIAVLVVVGLFFGGASLPRLSL